jgi:hypothetical protein
MANNIGAPFEMFTDTSGNPLEDGYLYIGTAGLNPETNPVAVYWDDGLTLAAAQPIRTLNGFPSRGGTASRLYVGSDYSITVKDKNSVIVFSTLTNPVSSASSINGTPIGNVTPSTGAFTTLTYSTSLTGTTGASLGWVTLTGGSAAQAVNGIYRPATNQFAVATNSVERLLLSSAGTWSYKMTAGGNSVDLTNGTTTFQMYLENLLNGANIGLGTNHPLGIITNGVVVARFAAGGGLTILAPATTTIPALVATGGASTPSVSVTFSATAMVVNCALSNVFATTFTANVTTAPTISNPSDGQTINWFITQDATGSRTMTWPTSFKWPSAVAGVLSTTANAVDLVVATYRSATGFWYASLVKDLR